MKVLPKVVFNDLLTVCVKNEDVSTKASSATDALRSILQPFGAKFPRIVLQLAAFRSQSRAYLEDGILHRRRHHSQKSRSGCAFYVPKRGLA